MHPEFDFVFVDSGCVPAFWFVPPPGLFLLFVSPFPLSVLGLGSLDPVLSPEFGSFFVDSGCVPAFWFVLPKDLFLLFVSPFPLFVLGLGFLDVVSSPDFGLLSNLGH